MKKFYSFLVAILLSVVAFAYRYPIVIDPIDPIDPIEIDGIYYYFNGENTATVSNGNYTQSEIVIPTKITYEGVEYNVTEIGAYAFEYCSSLTSIVIPNSVTKIGYYAFENCQSLTTITFSENINYVGYYAFSNTPWLENQTGYVYIGKCLYAYKGEAPEDGHINIKEGTVQICDYAFSNCWDCSSITSLTIPESVIYIASNVFGNFNSLKSAQWNAINCKDFSSHIYSPFYDGYNYENNYSIESFVFGEKVKHIPAHVCHGLSNLATITIPKSVTTVGYEAFEGTAWLENSDGCVYINNCLYRCKNSSSTQVEVKEGTTYIYPMAFSGSNITSVIIPNSVTKVGGGVFYRCSNLKSVVLSANIDSLPCHEYSDYGSRYRGFFQGCSSLESITIPNSIVEIGDLAFEGCSTLVSIVIPNSVTEIGEGVFAGCRSLKTVILSENIKTLNNLYYYDSYDYDRNIGFFEECESLESITIPNSVTEIGDDAFYGCSSLISIEIPNSVIYLGDKAFANCYSLRYAKLGNGFRTNNYEDEEEPYSYLGTNLFYFEEDYYYIDEDTENEKYVWISHPLDTLICEFKDCDLGESGGIGFDDDGLLQNPFNTTKNLRYFQGPAKLINIIKEEYQTHFTNKLTEIHITDGELDENGFNFINRSKKSLHTIDLAGTTNTTINDLAFYDCYKLENLALPKNLETIGYKAFADCKHLTELTIPASVTEIGESAFENCRSIDAINFAEGGKLETIGAWAFYNNHNLTGVSIPEGVKTIGDAAFYGCTHLEDITLPSTVQRVGDNGFALCNKVKRMEVKAVTPPAIEAKTFYEVSREIEFVVPEEAREAYEEHEYWKEFVQKAPTTIEDNESIELVVYTQAGTLYIEGVTSDYRLFDATGRLIYSGRDAQLSLSTGIYLLNVDNKTYKVAM